MGWLRSCVNSSLLNGRDTKLTANQSGQLVVDLGVSRDRRLLGVVSQIDPFGMLRAFGEQRATILAQVFEQLRPLHSLMTSRTNSFLPSGKSSRFAGMQVIRFVRRHVEFSKKQHVRQHSSMPRTNRNLVLSTLPVLCQSQFPHFNSVTALKS